MRDELESAQIQLEKIILDYSKVDNDQRDEFMEDEFATLQAMIYLAENDGERALPLLEKLLPNTLRKYPDPGSAFVLRIQLLIAKAKLYSEDCESLQIIRQLEDILQGQYNAYRLNHHTDMAETLQLLAKAHMQISDEQTAKQYQQDAINMLKEVFREKPGDPHSKITKAENILAEYQRATYRY
jgi:tetratricopeptide (TPR) repeat protein